MIRYDLKCGAGCAFDSWFRDSDAFEALRARGALSCPLCGDSQVEKALMAPGVATGRRAAAPTLSAPVDHPLAKAVAALRRKVESSADYVGRDFAAEARRIHEGAADPRAIWGEATRAEAEALIEEGAPVAPLPFARRDD